MIEGFCPFSLCHESIKRKIYDDCFFTCLFQFNLHNINHCWSQDGSVNILTRVRAGWPGNRVSIPGRDKRFSLLQGWAGV
jgi:hypothetical protein